MNVESANEEPLLLKVKQAAALCGCSDRTRRTWDAAGLTPKPVRIGRSVFWRPKELTDWIEAGCPNRKASFGNLPDSRQNAKDSLELLAGTVLTVTCYPKARKPRAPANAQGASARLVRW